MPRFEVYWQTEDKILVYLTCFQSKRAELVNPRHCRKTDTFLIYPLLLRKADPYFSGLIGCESKHKCASGQEIFFTFAIWKSQEENRPRPYPYPVLMWFALLGRSFIYLQQGPFRLIYAEGGLITLESGKLDFSSSLSTCFNELWRICLTQLVLWSSWSVSSAAFDRPVGDNRAVCLKKAESA